MRTTRRQVESMFERFTTATGHRVAESWNDVGGWALDYNPVYGGYVIEEVSKEHGGVSHPFGDKRHKPGLLTIRLSRLVVREVSVLMLSANFGFNVGSHRWQFLASPHRAHRRLTHYQSV